ncbi:sigma-70 family RNA polymerase sigma factor [Microbacterium sp. JB110]|uniref:sigma-70 family RNA polymerase sigma factor n=1 Tax=Microbacterium sp. JB110 TaxID=2024477 RepID=UPI00097EAC01|nr:sigma-70 family RNA polymerase sigma factor [Microbacterium sp. JB110]RCS61789.1 RNA polymerase subunit sigma-70 [Microbacterium sp. JB110]SJM65897.1 putative RNA polymerase sigma factor [Frigoribacterium sp. JB110]
MALESTERTHVDLGAEFTARRARLHAIAARTLGSPWHADDAVQETWLRLERADRAGIENLDAWLTTVVSRVCIDMLRQRAARRDEADADAMESLAASDEAGPAEAALRADDLALALQVVLDELGPLERLALVLHDAFALPYDEVALIVERTPTAARQLASRARARLRAVDVATVRERQGAAIDAFLRAAREGEFGDLLQLLDPDIELRSDDGAVALASSGAEHGAPLLEHRLRGADAVARVFAGRARLAEAVVVEGIPAAAYIAGGGDARAVYLVTMRGDRIIRIDVRTDVPDTPYAAQISR